VNSKPSWQSTIIALALIALAGGIFIVVFEKEGIDSGLKVWAVLGTLVGVITGAVPTYFFGQQATAAAREDSRQAHKTADEEKVKRDKAEEQAKVAETQAKVVLGFADKEAMDKALKLRPDIFTES